MFIKRIKERLLNFSFNTIRILKYNILSDILCVSGSPQRNQPVLIKGNGKVCFGESVIFGVRNSPNFYNGMAYIEARDKLSEVIFGDDIWINNNFTVISEFGKISIGCKCLIGCNVTIYNSDFHNINPVKRHEKNTIAKDVQIGANVFIGSNVIILKGVTIGDNSVIGAGAVVSESIPENSIVKCNNVIINSINVK